MEISAPASERDSGMPTGRLARLVWLAMISLLLLVSLPAAFYLRHRPPDEGSAVVNFTRDMIAHHGQAVEMALLIRDRSTDTELRQLALDIMLSQQAQLGQMQGWLAVWHLPLTGTNPPMAGMMGMATQGEVNNLQTLPVVEAEIAFLQLMIRHHQGGVTMATEVLRQTGRAETVRLASAIVQGQQSEIAYMEQLLAQRGAQPLMPASMEH